MIAVWWRNRQVPSGDCAGVAPEPVFLAPWVLLVATAALFLVAGRMPALSAWWHGQPWRRQDAWLAIALGVLTTVVRVPIRSRYLATWDSNLFAFALEDYDVMAARPHPPGYPVYIAMGRVGHAFGLDANDAFIAVGLLSHAAAVSLLYVLIRRFASVRAAAAGAFLFAIAPVPLYNSLIATTYPFEALFSVVAALLALRYRDRPSWRRAAWVGIAFAVGVGVRQSLLIFIAPLLAWAVLAAPGPWRRRMQDATVAAGSAIASALLWVVPMLQQSGGLERFREAASLQTTQVLFAHTVFNAGAEAWQDLVPRLVLYMEPELLVVVPMVALCVGAAAACGWRTSWPGPLSTLLAWWMAPALLFYLLVFNGWGTGPDGYILVLAPPFYLGAVVLADRALGHLARDGWTATATALVLLAPGIAHAAAWDDVWTDRIEDHDSWADSWAQLNDDPRFAPNNTGILASFSWTHAKWVHAEHHVWSLGEIPDPRGSWFISIHSQHHRDDRKFYDLHIDGPDGVRHEVPAGMERIVLYDFQIAGENDGARLLADDVVAHEAFLADGWRILYIDVEPGTYVDDYLSIEVNRYP